MTVHGERIATAIERIPSAGEPTASMRAICHDAGLPDEAEESLIVFLAAFGVLQVESPADGHMVKALSAAASFFLKSLAAYVRDGATILNNWERTGTSEPPYWENQVLSGSQFLYLLESRRLRQIPGHALSWLFTHGPCNFGAYLGSWVSVPTESLLTEVAPAHRAKLPGVRSVAIGECPRATVDSHDSAARIVAP
jgi:hypothetical protein